MKTVDRKKQQRIALDTLLKSIVQEGKIHAEPLKKAWKSIAPYLNRKRLVHFLDKNGVQLAKKAVDVILGFNKTLGKSIPNGLIAAGPPHYHSLIPCQYAGGKEYFKGNGSKKSWPRPGFLF